MISSIFNIFYPAVRIIQDEKESNAIQSDAYFPEWKPALREYKRSSFHLPGLLDYFSFKLEKTW